MNTTAILQCTDVSKTVQLPEQELTILSNISLSILAGESLAIVGSSGSGKTTLLGLLAGLDVPTSGQIRFEQQSIGDLSEDQRAEIRKGRISFVFQDFQLLENFTALENVALPLELLHHANAKETATRWLSDVGLAHRLHHYPRQLSGGEQQRVAIARAFAIEPIILFADEPTGNLDETTGAKIAELLFALNSTQKTTLVLVTHDQMLAGQCKNQLKLENGFLVTT